MLIALKKQDNLKPRLVLSAIESVQLANLMTATERAKIIVATETHVNTAAILTP